MIGAPRSCGEALALFFAAYINEFSLLTILILHFQLDSRANI